MDSTPSRQTVSFEEVAYSNMLTLNALIEQLGEKGQRLSFQSPVVPCSPYTTGSRVPLPSAPG